MRRPLPPGPLLLGSLLLLSGCSGLGTFLDNVFTFQNDPNRPLGNSETMRRVQGLAVTQSPLLPEAGDVWPGPLPPEPTLEQLMKEENQELKGMKLPPTQLPPLPSIPGLQPTTPPPAKGRRQPRGSSTPPASAQPGLPPLPNIPPLPETRLPKGRGNRPRILQTPNGPVPATPGPGGLSTTPNGAIVIPNGNGTSTIIGPDGSVTTVPTPR